MEGYAIEQSSLHARVLFLLLSNSGTGKSVLGHLGTLDNSRQC